MVWEVVQNVGGRADKYTADVKFLGDRKISKGKQIPVATAYYTPCIVAHLQQHTSPDLVSEQGMNPNQSTDTPDYGTYKKNTPLHLASKNGHAEIVRFLQAGLSLRFGIEKGKQHWRWQL